MPTRLLGKHLDLRSGVIWLSVVCTEVEPCVPTCAGERDVCGGGGRGAGASDLCFLIHHSGRAILDTSLSDSFMPQKAANGMRPECDGGPGVAQPAASSVSADVQTAQRTGAHRVAQDWLLSASLSGIRGAFRLAGYTRVTRVFMPVVQ